ncbi:MAG TPA: HNH endonuclease signature motif containing protein [Acidimicrobiia bacterium]|nr:HNH endonuclease signature motif containing protein [Acidimicrobiia bacterium]
MDEKELQAKRVAARALRSFTDDLGMVNIHARLLPEDGMRILARLEAEAQRAWLDGDRKSTVSQRLADGLVRLVDGTGTARRGKTELVLVSHVDAVARGYALPDEPCHIVGGPRVGVDVVKQLARDALITTVLHDGVKIESLSRASRSVTPALRLLLEIGKPPDFLESVCVECGSRYRLQLNHINPYAAGGETSYTNLGRLCPPCHAKETAEQYAAGLLRGTPDRWKAGRGESTVTARPVEGGRRDARPRDVTGARAGVPGGRPPPRAP